MSDEPDQSASVWIPERLRGGRSRPRPQDRDSGDGVTSWIIPLDQRPPRPLERAPAADLGARIAAFQRQVESRTRAIDGRISRIRRRD